MTKNFLEPGRDCWKGELKAIYCSPWLTVGLALTITSALTLNISVVLFLRGNFLH